MKEVSRDSHLIKGVSEFRRIIKWGYNNPLAVYYKPESGGSSGS